MQWGLRQQLLLGDRRSNFWLLKELEGISEGVRELTRHVALPNNGAPSALVDGLTKALRHAIAERWDEMPRKQPEKITRSPATTALLVIGVAVAAGAMVAASMWAYARLGLPPLPQFAVGFVFVVGLGLLSYVLFHVDPQISTKLSLMRDLGATINPITSKK